MIGVIIILAACIFFEGLFSGSEIALVAADKVKLRRHAEVAGRRGNLILTFLEDPGELISTSLVGTNICVVLSTVVATLTLLQWFPNQAELLSLAVMAPLILVFGEILPKSIFQNYADLLAPKAIYALSVFRFLVWPLVAMGSALSSILLRMVGLDRHGSVMTREELKLLLKLPSPREGADRITPQEKKIVTRIFSFKATTAEDVMLPLSEVTAVPVSASIEDVAQEIVEKQHTRIPLYQERLDQIVGIVHAYDLLRAGDEQQIRELSRPAIYVPENQPAVDTLLRLQRDGQGMAVVVDEYGGATGVITIEDILEEIVGEIEDEYDHAEAEQIQALPDGTYRVEGRTPIERVNEQAKVALPLDEDYESIAGLILDQLKRIPRVGEEVVINRVSLTVTKASERSVDEVRLRIVRRKTL
jgi:CBS domain containing-hemolysin-like protein